MFLAVVLVKRNVEREMFGGSCGDVTTVVFARGTRVLRDCIHEWMH